MTEEELWNWMMDGNYPPNWPEVESEHRTAIATLSREIKTREGKTIAAGTRVKVVMASRFGDVGITTDLNTDYGYEYRTQCVPVDADPELGIPAIGPAELLTDITPA